MVVALPTVKLEEEELVVEAFKVTKFPVVPHRVVIVAKVEVRVEIYPVREASTPPIVRLEIVEEPRVDEPDTDRLVDVMFEEFRLVVVALVKVALVLFRLVNVPVVPVI